MSICFAIRLSNCIALAFDNLNPLSHLCEIPSAIFAARIFHLNSRNHLYCHWEVIEFSLSNKFSPLCLQLYCRISVRMQVQSIVADVIGLCAIGFLTLPSILSILRTPYQKKGTPSWGDHKDGITTVNSENVFNSKIPKIYLGVFVLLGILIFIMRTLQFGSTDYSLEQVVTNSVGWVSVALTILHH